MKKPARDRSKLTDRGVTVAELVAQGRSNAEIAEALAVSATTVKRHLTHIMIKWDCANRTHLAAKVGAVKAARLPAPISWPTGTSC